MRTTLTLDDDLGQLLKQRCKERDASFKEVVNEAIRAGLAALREHHSPAGEPFRVTPFSSGTPRFPDIVGAGDLLALVDEEETERPRR